MKWKIPGSKSIIVAFILYATTLQAQELEWEETIGGIGLDFLQELIQTNDHGYLAAGFTYSGISVDKTEALNGFVDYWIVKLDSIGNTEWDRGYGGSAGNALSTAIQTTDGGYLLGGVSNSDISGDKSEDTRGSNDYWLVKISVTGDVEWDKTLGGSAVEEATGLIQTNDNGYMIVGSSNSDISGEKTQDSKGFLDFWVVKLDSIGNVEWDATYGGSGNDNAFRVEQTTDNGYIIGGYSDSGISGDKTEVNEGFFDYWVIKVDAAGVIEWDRTLGGFSSDVLRAVSQTSDGGYLLAGNSSSGISGSKSQDSYGGDDYWVLKLSDSGTILWDYAIGGNSGDYLYDAIETADGHFFLAGHSSSEASDIKSESPIGSSDFWAVKIDETGAVLWDNTVGGSSSELLFTADLTAEGGYIMGGYSSSGISGDKTEGLIGGTDFYIAKLQADVCTTPIYLMVSGLTGSTADLSWDPVPFSEGYILQFINTTTGEKTRASVGAAITSVHVGPSKLSPGFTYLWRVRTRCSEGNTDWSDISSFTTPLRLAGDIQDMARVYPNPTSGVFQIQLPDNLGEMVSIYIIDAVGRQVQSYTSTAGAALSMQLDRPGVYQILVVTDGFRFTDRLVVQ